MLSGFISYLIGLSLLKANFNLSVKQIHYDNGEEFRMKHFFFFKRIKLFTNIVV